MSMLPIGLVGGENGHVNWHNELHKGHNAGEITVPVVADGVTNNHAAIIAAMDAATPGSVLRFPRGPIVTAPFTVSKCLHLVGAGPWSTRFIPTTNTTSPLITFDRTIDSGFGIFDNYGPSISGIGISRQGHMSGPCLSLTANSAWMRVQNVLCSGGTKSILHRAPNALIENVWLWDASDCMLDIDENGLELHLRHAVLSANVQAVNTYIRIAISAAVAGTLLGAIYMDDVTGNAAGVSVTNGMTIIAPTNSTPDPGETVYTELPFFGEKVILDNVIGGGPVVTLTNIASFSLVNSWLNGLNGCVKMDGCINPQFSTNRYRGGTHTYEFGTARTTIGFQSDGCEAPTGPIYKVGASNKPTHIYTNDNITSAAGDIGNVTNDATWFENASRRTWGQRRFQGHLRRREAGASPPSGFVFLSSGLATVNHPLVGVNTRVRVWHERPGSSPGIIYSSVADNVVGTSFKIRSTSAADNAGVYWEFVGDGD